MHYQIVNRQCWQRNDVFKKQPTLSGVSGFRVRGYDRGLCVLKQPRSGETYRCMTLSFVPVVFTISRFAEVAGEICVFSASWNAQDKQSPGKSQHGTELSFLYKHFQHTSCMAFQHTDTRFCLQHGNKTYGDAWGQHSYYTTYRDNKRPVQHMGTNSYEPSAKRLTSFSRACSSPALERPELSYFFVLLPCLPTGMRRLLQ